MLLGPYGEGQGAGLGTFFGDFFGDLANGEVRAWALALGPLTLISLIRTLFLGTHLLSTPPPSELNEPIPPADVSVGKTSDQRRVEPRISE
jgi:hypothetical protein